MNGSSRRIPAYQEAVAPTEGGSPYQLHRHTSGEVLARDQITESRGCLRCVSTMIGASILVRVAAAVCTARIRLGISMDSVV